MGSWIELGDGTRAWRSPPGASGPGVLVLHPWWGLGEPVRAACDALAAEGLLALAPDLFGDGRVVDTIEEAQGRADAADGNAIGARAVAGLEAVLADADRSGPAVGALGFSLGAAWALVLAQERPELSAAVVYYGTEGGGDWSRSQADVLGHFAEDDPWEPEPAVAGLEAGLRGAGRSVELHRYAGVRHWFAEPDRPEHDAAAADLAWRRTVTFLRERLEVPVA